MIIITGASGFIGSCLVKKYNDMGREDIICVDRFGTDNRWMNLRGLKYKEFFHADQFLESGICDTFFEKGIDAVYHMGACSTTTEQDMDFLYKNNIQYSQILFSLCREYNVPFCYASSAATYGAGENGYNDHEAEIYKLMPLNKYGYSKHFFDEWVLTETEKPEKWYGMKFFNVYGPNENHKGAQSSVVFQSFHQIKDIGVVKLFKSHRPDYEHGKQLRDFVYVKDVVELMYKFVEEEHHGASGIYNCGTGKARSFLDLTTATFNAMAKKVNIEFIDMPETLRDQYQYFTEANMSKVKNVFPDFKFTSLEDGVKDYVQNYLMQPNPYLDSRKTRK